MNLEAEEIEAFLAESQNWTLPDPDVLAGLRSEARRHLRRLRGEVTLGITGEFNSGKSTLVNLLCGHVLLETSMIASNLPPVTVSNGPETAAFGCWWDRTDRTQLELGDLRDGEISGFDYIAVTVPSSLLRTVTIIDLPGLNDPSRNNYAWLDAAEPPDAMIWCTNAVNAWRESERRACDELMPTPPERSILVVTHVDLKAVRNAVGRLLRRLKGESATRFREILTIAAPQAASATRNGEVVYPEGWSKSGAQAIEDAIRAIADDVRRSGIDAARAFVEDEVRPWAARQSGGAGAVATPDPLSIWTGGLASVSTAQPTDPGVLAGIVEETARALDVRPGTEWLGKEFREVAGLLKGGSADVPDLDAVLLQLDRDLRLVVRAADDS